MFTQKAMPLYLLSAMVLATACDDATVDATADDPTQFRSSSQPMYPTLGRSIAIADIEGNGEVDIVIGDPEAGANCATGEIEVSYDADINGLANPETWDRDSSGVLGAATCDSDFGASVATGDFNADGYTDTAVGVPRDTVSGNTNAGSVHILYGTSSGVTSTGNQIFSQDSSGVVGLGEAYDAFGKAVAAGDFNCDGYGDLAVGVPGEGVGTATNAGAVNILYGSSTGLSATGNQIIYQGQSAIVDSSETDDYFGAFLAAGNIDGDLVGGNNCDDLAIGVPGEGLLDANGVAAPIAGAVAVIYGSSSGLDTSSDELWHQGSPGIPDDNERSDEFGFGLTLVDVDADGYADLYTQSVGDNMVFTIYGTSGGLSSTNATFALPPLEGFWENACRFACEYTCSKLPPGLTCDCASWCSVIAAPTEACGDPCIA